MAFYMDVFVRNYLASYNKRFTKFKNKQIPFSDKPFSQNVSWHRFRKRDTL